MNRAPSRVGWQGGISDNPPLAILLVVGGVSILPLTDASAKILADTLPVLEITWGRFFSALWILLPVVFLRYGRRAFRPPRPGLQIARGICLAGATLCFFSALKYLPLADTLAIFFIQPLIVTALSPVVLGETVGRRRWIAVITGFIGTLLIIRPGFAEFNIGIGLALASGFIFAGVILITRQISGTASPLVTLAFTSLAAFVVLSIAMPFVWVWPTAQEWAMIAIMGVVTSVAHYMIIKAYDLASAPTLAPFGYTEMIAAVAIGFVLFGDWPDLLTFAGIAVLAASGAYIAIREGRARMPKA